MNLKLRFPTYQQAVAAISFLSILMFEQCSERVMENTTTKISVIPEPATLARTSGAFTINAKTVIVIGDERARGVARLLSGMISSSSDFEIPVVTGSPSASTPSIVMDLADSVVSGSDRYVLKVDPDRIIIRAHSPQGLFYGSQTLRQLLPSSIEKKDKGAKSWTVPAVSIEDQSQFAWRGMHLDVSRHFFSVEFVKQFIDRLGLYKFNRLHLHLTDDQGWRVEIKKYPQLTEKGAWRVLNEQDSVCLDKAKTNADFQLPDEFFKTKDGVRYYGGYYSQEDIREIVRFAGERFITVVPEIDMPGHMNAAISSFPELTCADAAGWGELFSIPLCPCEETTYEFIGNVIAETAGMFPGEYIHMGADEVDESTWMKSPACKKLMQQRGMKERRELHSYFVNRVNDIIRKHGKRSIGWDEITDGVVDTSITVMYWRGWVTDAPARAAGRGHHVVMSPTSHCYFDYEPDETTLQKMHSFDPLAGLNNNDEAKVIGLQANIWTEYIPSAARLDYMTMPRMAALAEVGWNPGKDWNDFHTRVTSHFTRWDEMDIKYRLPDLPGMRQHVVFTDREVLELKIPEGIHGITYTLDGADPDPASPSYEQAIPVDSTTTVKLLTLGTNKRPGNRYTIRFEKQTFMPPVSLSDADPGLECRYFEGAYSSATRINDSDLKKQVITDSIRIPEFARTSVFALEFNGFIEIPRTGIYTFYLSSDDGSTLMIGDRTVVNNDGYHGNKEAGGQVALSQGVHPFVLKYFDGGGGNNLGLKIEGPEMAKQEIPVAWFKRDVRQ